MFSIKLFRLVFCLFRFNRNIETLCFHIELKQTVSKQTETTLIFFEKIPKYALFHTILVAFDCFGSIETPKFCVGIEPKQTFCFE
jgi:hypothetical protein